MKTYYFKESRITWLIYIFLLAVLLVVLLRHSAGGIFIIMLYALIFLYTVCTLTKEVTIADDRVIARNYFGFKVNIPNRKIIVYGGDADSAQFYIIGVTSLYLPAFFQGTLRNKEAGAELLAALESLTNKKKGVIF